MSTLYYLLTIAIWGTTWFAIHMKMENPVDIDYAVGIRFAMAGLIMLPFVLKEARRLSMDRHIWIMLQGLCFSGINFGIFYYVSTIMASGLMAIIYSSIVLFNVINGALLFRYPVRPTTIVGGLIGTCGLILIFLPDMLSISSQNWDLVKAILLSFLATYIASVGNVIAAENQRQGVSTFCCSSLGMLYSGTLFIAIGFFTGEPFFLPSTWAFWGPTLYLTIIGSSLALFCYFNLIKRLGPDRGAYVLVITPIVALCVSTFFEGFQWQTSTYIGVTMAIAGNVIALLPQKYLKHLPFLRKVAVKQAL